MTRESFKNSGMPSSPEVYPVMCSLKELYDGCSKSVYLTATKETVDIEVPAGARHGVQLPSCHDGVVFTVVELLHPSFAREGDDLVVRHEVLLEDAVCGVTLEIEHLNGKLLQMEVMPMRLIPAGEASTTFWSWGMPRMQMGKSYGDLHLHVSFKPPSKLPGWQKQAIRTALPGAALQPEPPALVRLTTGVLHFLLRGVVMAKNRFVHWLQESDY